MRKFILLAAIGMISVFQAKTQAPQLTVDGKSSTGVHLTALKIAIKVCGTTATTTWQMTFKNTTSRVLEGTLNFPLKDGLSISRYALDINGKMREAVPVERSKGTEIFENIERRNIDPGILEKVDGNTFRTRIYPINPNSTRTVLIGYEEGLSYTNDAALHYQLPLDLKDTVNDFDLDIAVIQSAASPVFDPSLTENTGFSKSNNFYTAVTHRNDYVPAHSISFSIPKPTNMAEVMLQEFETNYYYVINTRLQKNEKEKPLPASVGLLWDVSLSGENRDHKKEFELLDRYFRKLNNVNVNLVAFSNTIKKTAAFNVSQGNWDELKAALNALTYDGATNLGVLDMGSIKADEYLLVSDGRQTLGNRQVQLGSKPVYCITSTTAADYSNLKFIAGKTGGILIDLQQEDIEAAFKKLTTTPYLFLGIKQNALVKESYPSMPVAVNGSLTVSGIADPGIKEITLQFGYGNKVSYEKNIAVNAETQLCENFDITKIYAQKKIAELDIQYDQNRQEIERTGRQFNIVTRNTSLIVLENINDYIQYQVEPPAELRAEYDRIMKQRSENVITKKKDELENSLRMINTLRQWYDPQAQLKEQVTATRPAATTADITNTRPAPTSTVSAQTQQVEHPANTPPGEPRIINGRVNDPNGNAIAFASVRVRGSASGIAADGSGNYAIRAREGEVLEISATGFNAAQVAVGNQDAMTTTLQRRGKGEMEEVVVTAAAGIKRQVRSLGYSTATVNNDELTRGRATNVGSALTGKVSGLQVNNINNGVNGDIRMTLRGNRSILGNNQALLVVDNMQVPLDYINSISPNDVENVTVLKGASASALYGSAASNGVIMITTRKFKPLPGSTNDDADDSTAVEENPVFPVTPVVNKETFDYLRAIRGITRENRYAKYLELRSNYLNKPTYFFEVAGYFLKTGDKATGLTILSNLAEMENGNYELYKMLGYKLKEAGEFEGELSAFKKVLELRPADPQSYRDCALAWLDIGNYQQALDMLYAGMTKGYSDEMNRMYHGIEEIFLTEINRIIALHRNELDLKNIDEKIIASLPTDLRVVMNWNKSNTDIDLWVTDPNGEKCYYSHKSTAIGGRISSDFTQGFGPEQFMLKKAIKGKYKIQINYYSDRQFTIAGPTTVMAEIYLYYGTPREEKRIVTLQMQKDKNGEVFIGEVEL